MTDLTTLLREADPLRGPRPDEDGLSAGDAQAIRRAMFAAASEQTAVFPVWQRPVTLAAVAAMMLIVSGIAGHRISSTRPGSGVMPSAAATGGSSSSAVDRRQLQFATPGGTRIIWIFDQNLRLQESMP